ncbi:MAG: Hsp20/alpha crystallin family protein [Candidatus Aureabacteria bacterium]|nr:Hsp20/alpha crystallin family protein [Candidatus Auribacterota bacterium]
MDELRVLGSFRQIERGILNRIWGEESLGPVFMGVRFEPCVDVYETAEGTVVKMEIAGMKKKDIQVEIEGDVLTIRGRRREIAAGRKVAYHQMEIAYGLFERRIKLAVPVRRGGVTAACRDGFLEVHLPHRCPRRITS